MAATNATDDCGYCTSCHRVLATDELETRSDGRQPDYTCSYCGNGVSEMPESAQGVTPRTTADDGFGPESNGSSLMVSGQTGRVFPFNCSVVG